MKDLFEQLKQSKELLEDAIAAKNKFFSIIAHDLKNPFQVLLNSSYLLENNFNSMDDSKKIKMIKSISQSSNFTYSLLENLLKWSSTQTGTMKFAPSNINLKWLAEKAIQVLYLQAEQKNIQLSVEIPEQYNAFCDSDMIDTVFRNVVSNAIKFSNEAGKVSIKASINSDSTGYLLSIEDSGVGMPEDIRIRIFDLAENVSRKGTQKERGSGLGLILCKEFIEKHGGWIWVESEEGKGSTFNFTLPL
jgi:signal transduction histidine kinase